MTAGAAPRQTDATSSDGQRAIDRTHAPLVPTGFADQPAIDHIVERDPRNGRYGFDREDVLRQLLLEANHATLAATASRHRGARKTLVHTETLLHLAALAHAALTGTQPEEQNHDNL